MSYDRMPVVRNVDGQLILDDPDAQALGEVIALHNCQQTVEVFRERIQHFIRRATERGDDPSKVVVVLIWAFDEVGGPLADALMPGEDWQAQAASGFRPFARGLAGRKGIELFLADHRPAAGEALKVIRGLAVVVIDHGIALVYSADEFG